MEKLLNTGERNQGIDLLRLILMFMVCMLHILGQGGILEATVPGTSQHVVFWFIEIASFCAVDGFALLSGYMDTGGPSKYSKIVNMWFQAFFYSFVITAVFTLIGLNPHWSFKDMIISGLPVTFNAFWYFTAYFVLFFFMPGLNRIISMADETNARIVFLLLVFLFSCVGYYWDPFKTGHGYSTLWIIAMYCIGATARQGRIAERKKTFVLILFWAGCVMLTWMLKVLLGSGLLVYYNSPTILISGLMMVLVFSRIKIKSKIITWMTPLAFGIYLFQLNQIVWNKILHNAFAAVAESNIIGGVIYAAGLALLLFVAGAVIEFVRRQLAKAIRIPAVSNRIVTVFMWALRKLEGSIM